MIAFDLSAIAIVCNSISRLVFDAMSRTTVADSSVVPLRMTMARVGCPSAAAAMARRQQPMRRASLWPNTATLHRGTGLTPGQAEGKSGMPAAPDAFVDLSELL